MIERDRVGAERAVVRRGTPADELALATVICFGAHALPSWVAGLFWPRLSGAAYRFVVLRLGWGNFSDLLDLAYGLLLALPTAVRSGLRIGTLRDRPWRTLLVCAIPVVTAAIVYPRLPVRPFAGQRAGMWLISPLAQDLVFMGYLYGRFQTVWPGRVHRRLPIGWALVVTGLFFAAWHLPNFFDMPAGYVLFQLGYTFAGLLLVGMSRQWTGSILYGTLTHMAVNFIAWQTK